MRLILLTIALGGAGLYLLWRHRKRLARARAEAEATTRIDGLTQRLAQANKLATLGQVAAGVGHEINQPVTAIGTYAHNARALIARGDTVAATEAVDRIAALTTRIGIITRELRGFARRTSAEAGPVAVDEAIEGALLLLRDRIRTLGAQVEQPADTGIRVIAEHVRLEQVLVNLLANALDAGAGVVAITVAPERGMVAVTIRDDGPGLSPAPRRRCGSPRAGSTASSSPISGCRKWTGWNYCAG
jgi:two-component system C4-dicarboxylate transport sensor histidine kinase DctB